MVTTYTEMAEYSNFVAEMIIEQQQMENYINQCVMSTMPTNLQEQYVLNEGKAGDRIKGFFNKIKEFFSRLFAKFSEKMSALFKNNKEYLEKYKNIIIGKQVTIETVTMKNHEEGMARIEAVLNKPDSFAIAPSDNFWEQLRKETVENQSGALGDVDKFDNALRKKLLADLQIDSTSSANGIRVDDDTNFSVACTNFFDGSEEEMDFTGDSLNMEHIFNSLYSYDKLVASLNKLKNSYMNNLNKIESTYSTKLEEAIKTSKEKGHTNATASEFDKMYDEFKKYANAKTDSEVEAIKSTIENSINNFKSSDVYSNLKDDAKKNLEAELKKMSEDSTKQAEAAKTRIKNSTPNNANAAKVEGETPVHTADDKTKKQGNANESYDYNLKYQNYSSLNELNITSSSNKNDKTNDVNVTAAADASKKVTTSVDKTVNQNKNINVDTGMTDSFTANARKILAMSGAEGFNQNAYIELAQKYLQKYSAARNNLFGGMLNGLHHMNKDYMDIVRYHVKSHLGKESDTETNTGKTSIGSSTNSGTSAVGNNNNNNDNNATPV